MKKNKMMRIASVLLVLTLISTCAISGTFAKYVTKASGEDKARVAKWGIVLTMEGDAVFSTQYETDDTKFAEDYSVISANDDNVVAPGTEGEHIKATIKGAPEVAFRLILGLTVKNEICLPAKDGYTDYTELVPTTANGKTTYGYTNTFDLDEDYYPVQFVLKSGTKTATGSIEDITTALQNVVASMGGTAGVDDASGTLTGIPNAIYADFPANCTYFENGVELDLSWKWDFSDAETPDAVTLNDKADTYLGNVAAGVVEDADAVTDMEVTFTAIAVQID